MFEEEATCTQSHQIDRPIRIPSTRKNQGRAQYFCWVVYFYSLFCFHPRGLAEGFKDLASEVQMIRVPRFKFDLVENQDGSLFHNILRHTCITTMVDVLNK